jgi:hypothetical protein
LRRRQHCHGLLQSKASKKKGLLLDKVDANVEKTATKNETKRQLKTVKPKKENPKKWVKKK